MCVSSTRVRSGEPAAYAVGSLAEPLIVTICDYLAEEPSRVFINNVYVRFVTINNNDPLIN